MLVTLVISLARSRERRAAIRAGLDALGIAHEIVEGVDGTAIGDFRGHPDVDFARSVETMGRVMLPGEFGCALSHVAAYRRFLASAASHALILEDDAELRPELGELVAGGHYARFPMLTMNYRMTWADPRSTLHLFGAVTAQRLANSPQMAVCYTLDRPTAQRLLAAAWPVHSVADWPIDLTRLGAWATTPQLVGHPPLHAIESSTIGARPDRPRPLRAYFTAGYLRRKWMKMRSVKISG